MAAGRVCAVCARVLDSHTLLGWVHAKPDRDGEDHPPVPVSPGDVQVRGRCDFCGADDPRWVIPTSSFQAAPGHGSDGDWAACDGCADLIRQDDWDGLVRRVTAAFAGTDPNASTTVLKIMYSELRRHIQGPPTHL